MRRLPEPSFSQSSSTPFADLMSYGHGFIAKIKIARQKFAAKHPDAGDVWLWVAIDAQSKLVLSWKLGDRSAVTAKHFIEDVASRLNNRVQITTDGLRTYLDAIEGAFGSDCDYAMLQKIYGSPIVPEVRYSPPQCIGCQMAIVTGNPDPVHISTSFIERQNWTVRTNMRRYTRLSNGFSRNLRNHDAAVALNYFAYNFIKIHRTLKVTPAMAAGVTKRLWEVDDLVTLWETYERGEAIAA
jgi:IS1 family transposase